MSYSEETHLTDDMNHVYRNKTGEANLQTSHDVALGSKTRRYAQLLQNNNSDQKREKRS